MFWNNVKSELDYLGIQLKEFCFDNKLNYNSICNAISKNTIPNIELVYKIASALNLSMDYLYTGNNIPGLNDDEMEVLRLYKGLSKQQKNILKLLLNNLNGISPEITPDENNFIYTKK